MDYFLCILTIYCPYRPVRARYHYSDVIMATIASQITSLTIVYSTGYSDADQRKHHSSASLAFVWGIHRGPVNSLHKWPVTRKMFPFDDVIMWGVFINEKSGSWFTFAVYEIICYIGLRLRLRGLFNIKLRMEVLHQVYITKQYEHIWTNMNLT